MPPPSRKTTTQYIYTKLVNILQKHKRLKEPKMYSNITICLSKEHYTIQPPFWFA